MPLLINIESTADEPVRFFLMYHHGGRKMHERQYKALNEPYRYYDAEKHMVVVFVETRIDGEVKEGTWEEYSLEDYIRDRFEEETLKSTHLITEVFRTKGESENTWAYKRLLRAFVNHYERLKNFPDYPENELLPSAFKMIVEYAVNQYDHMFSFPLISKVKAIIKSDGAVNTGYVIKSEFRHHIVNFNEELIRAKVIDLNTTPEQWFAFFRGELPHVKINWKADPPNGHLWYFIKKIKESELLLSFPKQPYKNIDRIFTFDGEIVPKKFYHNHSLNKESKKVLNQAFKILKS